MPQPLPSPPESAENVVPLEVALPLTQVEILDTAEDVEVANQGQQQFSQGEIIAVLAVAVARFLKAE